jgi:circadian clock protein KaiB
VTDAIDQLEKALAESMEGRYVLRLFIAGSTPQSARAVANITRICADYLEGNYELTVVDLYQQPQEAQSEQIIAAPTLAKLAPLPRRRLIGDLSDTDRVLQVLGLRPKAQ